MRLPAADHQLLKLAIVLVAQVRFEQRED
jgi:hypothetical protein